MREASRRSTAPSAVRGAPGPRTASLHPAPLRLDEHRSSGRHPGQFATAAAGLRDLRRRGPGAPCSLRVLARVTRKVGRLRCSVRPMRRHVLRPLASAALRTCERPAASTGSPGGGLESGEARHGDSTAPGSSPVPNPLSWSPNATWWSEDVRPYGLPERSERARWNINTPRAAKWRASPITSACRPPSGRTSPAASPCRR